MKHLPFCPTYLVTASYPGWCGGCKVRDSDSSTSGAVGWTIAGGRAPTAVLDVESLSGSVSFEGTSRGSYRSFPKVLW